MTTNKPKANNLKDFDFDTIFDKPNPKPVNQIPQNQFESFRDPKECSNHVPKDSLMRQVHQNNISPNIQDNKNVITFSEMPDDSSNVRSSLANNPNQNNPIRQSNQAFDDFDFALGNSERKNSNQSRPQNINSNLNSNSKKSQQNDLFDLTGNNIQLNQKNVAQVKQDLDVDLMGIDIGQGILNQDITNMEQNLFKKEQISPDLFGSNEQVSNIGVKYGEVSDSQTIHTKVMISFIFFNMIFIFLNLQKMKVDILSS